MLYEWPRLFTWLGLEIDCLQDSLKLVLLAKRLKIRLERLVPELPEEKRCQLMVTIPLLFHLGNAI